MRTSVVVLCIATFFSTAASGLDQDNYWTPNAEQIAAVEARMAEEIAAAEARLKVRLIPLRSLDMYVRYYAGVTTSGYSYIQGKLVPPSSNNVPGIQVVEGKLSPLQGDGCVSRSDTDGRVARFRCARLGAWTPSAVQIAELEDALRRNGVQWIDKFTAYARHYAGVTEGDRRIIEGVLVAHDKYYMPGIYIESEAELPGISDGGCFVVDVKYDPSTKTIEAQCHGEA